MEKNWYFANNGSPSNEVADKLIDSKFGMDKVGSFVREIIQNSLDALDKDLGENIPVIVNFDYKKLTLDQIPGGDRLKEILLNCYNVEMLNHQTKDMYSNGLNVLNSNEILCLKISDENTIGVEPGLDKAWGAFLYDEGISRKIRPGSAGSHGVGKKAPFIISGVHTVFYSTNYKGNKLFQGKTSLVNWSENGEDFDYKGWYGSVDKNNTNRRERILPISYEDKIEGIDEFFLRTNKPGTDVTIIDASFVHNIELAKKRIVNSILENFFVAIKRNKLVCNVFGDKIDANSLEAIINKYYAGNDIKFKVNGNLVEGNLKNYYKAFNVNQPMSKLDVVVDGNKYGHLEIYFDLYNDLNKKYFSFIREHGMKIKDVRVQCEQAFSAVVVAMDNNQEYSLNKLLASRENAAHDEFIIDDEQVPCDETTKKVVKEMDRLILEFIKKHTELKVDNQSFLDSLSDMLEIPGSTSKGNVSKPKIKVKKKKKEMLEPGKGKEDPKGKAGVSAGGGSGNGNGGRGKKKKIVSGNEVLGYLYTSFEQEPVFFKVKDKYILKFIPKDSGNATIGINPVSVDGGETRIENIVLSANQKNSALKIKGNYVKKASLVKGEVCEIEIALQIGLDYTLDCDVLLEVTTNEK